MALHISILMIIILMIKNLMQCGVKSFIANDMGINIHLMLGGAGGRIRRFI